MKMGTTTTHVEVAGDQGTLVVLYPLSEAADAFFAEHLPADCARYGIGYVVEHRFARDILEGLAEAGLDGLAGPGPGTRS